VWLVDCSTVTERWDQSKLWCTVR